jgi:hypothetical protein
MGEGLGALLFFFGVRWPVSALIGCAFRSHSQIGIAGRRCPTRLQSRRQSRAAEGAKWHSLGQQPRLRDVGICLKR